MLPSIPPAADMESTETKTSSNTKSSTRYSAGAQHVLFGRGKGCANCPANKRMQRIISKYRGQYIGGARLLKRRLLKKAYAEITEGGVKFLKQVGNEDKWVEVDEEEAMRKVGHSMRWRKGSIRESPVKPVAGPSLQGDVQSSHTAAAPPRLRQDQQPPLAASTHGLEGVLLRPTIEHFMGCFSWWNATVDLSSTRA